MATHILERFAYGRPLDPTRDETRIPVVSRDTTALLGRVMLAAIFLVSGFAKLIDTSGTVGHMTAQGLPAPGILVYVAAAAEILGALSLIAGFVSRIGAIALIAFLVITTLVFHDFWTMTGDEQRLQMIQFLKNTALIGGLLLIVAHGPGRYSLDDLLRRPMQP
jgi:putative oxidoreductase